MVRRATQIAIIFTAALLVATAGAATEETTRWLNVTVSEPSTETNVEVHLPLNLVISVINSVDVENFHAGKVDLEIDDADIDWPEVLKAIKDAPDGNFVKVDSPEANVNVSKRAGFMYIDVKEREHDHAEVKVTLPISMVDALNIDEQNRIDIGAFLKAIDDLPNGELVRVTSDEANVRVWVE